MKTSGERAWLAALRHSQLANVCLVFWGRQVLRIPPVSVKVGKKGTAAVPTERARAASRLGVQCPLLLFGGGGISASMDVGTMWEHPGLTARPFIRPLNTALGFW